MRDNRFLKRLRKKAKKGLRGWPLATIAFYGPNLSQATKAAVGIIPSENAEAEEMRAWHVLHGDIQEDVSISQEIVEKAYARVSGASRFSVQNRNTRVSCSSVSEEQG